MINYIGIYKGKLKYGKMNVIAENIFKAKIKHDKAAIISIIKKMNSAASGLRFDVAKGVCKTHSNHYCIGTATANYINQQRGKKAPVKGSTVLLVDDVVYSGKTIEAYKTKLMKQGAKKVIILVYGKAKV